MAAVVARKLIFHLGEVGFVINLSCVVEICEQIAGRLDGGCADLPAGIVGALSFRHTSVPAIDPTIRFDLLSTFPSAERVALILNSAEGNWALLVDRVGEILPADRFQACEMPPILRVAVSHYYSEINMFNGEPFVLFEPERFYGPAGVVS